MIFYIDVIFVENIIMNYIILFATGLIIKNNLKHMRIFLSSLLGATYAIMSYISNLEIYENQIIKFILSVVMTYIAFNPKSIKKMIKTIVIFYLTSFCFGGAAYYLLYYISPEQIKNINGVLTGSYPIKIAILGGILGFFIINIGFKIVKNKIDKHSIYYDIEIAYQEKKVRAKVILDTGNLLVEPITSFPVVIIEENIIKKLLSVSDINILSNALTNSFDGLSDELKLRCRIIPFSSVGKTNGMIIGFKPDYIKIFTEEDNENIINNVIVGIYNKQLSKSGRYQGLIGLELLNSENGKMGDLSEYNSNVKI